MADYRRAVRRRLAALAALVSLGVPAIAAGALRSFEAEAGRYLAGHRVEGIGDFAALGSALAVIQLNNDVDLVLGEDSLCKLL